MSEDIMGRLGTALERFEEATFWATRYGEQLVAALAAVEQEIAELRKRPTLEEALAAVVGAYVGDVNNRLRALYAEKAK